MTNNEKKIYASLSQAKGRKEHGMFMAQGTKCVLDTIDYFEVVDIIATDAWTREYNKRIDVHNIDIVKPADLQKITTLTTAPEVIAIYRIPESEKPVTAGRLTLALDGVQDPGNLGTIIRVADWMGVTDIVASKDTVDVYNPKVVQATMGAISRVSVYYTDLAEFIRKQHGAPVYGTFLDGKDIYNSKLNNNGLIVMGNEGRGIRADVEQAVTHRLYIPPYPIGRATSESLNVAVATAITLAEFRRQAQTEKVIKKG